MKVNMSFGLSYYTPPTGVIPAKAGTQVFKWEGLNYNSITSRLSSSRTRGSSNIEEGKVLGIFRQKLNTSHYNTHLPNCTILDPRVREDDNGVGHGAIRKTVQLNHSWFPVFTGTAWILAFARMTPGWEITEREGMPS